MRFFRYSERTEDAYWQRIARFLHFHRHPGVIGVGSS